MNRKIESHQIAEVFVPAVDSSNLLLESAVVHQVHQEVMVGGYGWQANVPFFLLVYLESLLHERHIRILYVYLHDSCWVRSCHEQMVSVQFIQVKGLWVVDLNPLAVLRRACL